MSKSKDSPQTQPTSKQRVSPRSDNQRLYLEAIAYNDMVFGIGPAGTGKTYLAVSQAVAAYRSKNVNRIILARPAVEAGEKLGFLPGSMQEKVDPYMRPLYDALYDLMESDKVDLLVDNGTIEVAPLAFMRGRTLNKAFVILDEAQNTTPEQMKMFLTRMGPASKCVVTGDITQIDLPENKDSGLLEAMDVLNGVEGISFQYFTDADVVRHPLVQRIVQAYEGWECVETGFWMCPTCGEEYAVGVECDLCSEEVTDESRVVGENTTAPVHVIESEKDLQ